MTFYLFPFLCLILALLALPGRFAATFLLFAEEDWLCREGLKALMSAEEAEVFLFIPLFLPPKPNFTFCKVRTWMKDQPHHNATWRRTRIATTLCDRPSSQISQENLPSRAGKGQRCPQMMECQGWGRLKVNPTRDHWSKQWDCSHHTTYLQTYT